MAGKRECPGCGQIGHPLRDCPFRGFYDPTQAKASPASSQSPAMKTAPISYAQKRLMALKKRQKVHQPRSHGFQKKPSPLALYSETLTSSEDAIDTTPIAESTISSNSTGESKPV